MAARKFEHFTASVTLGKHISCTFSIDLKHIHCTHLNHCYLHVIISQPQEILYFEHAFDEVAALVLCLGSEVGGAS